MIKYQKNVKSVHMLRSVFFFANEENKTNTYKASNVAKSDKVDYVRSDQSDLGAGAFNLKV